MIYDKRIATVSRAEFDELIAIVRAPPATPRVITAEDHWRREYQAEQERRRVIGYQADLFTAKPVTHYHRHRLAPSWDRTPDETIEEKLERIAGDRLATFGPLRADRPAFLTAGEKAEIIAKAANWLRVSQRIRLIDAPGSVDPAFGIQRYLGRYGVVWRLCGSPFSEHCYVFFDPVAASEPPRSNSPSCATLNPRGERGEDAPSAGERLIPGRDHRSIRCQNPSSSVPVLPKRIQPS
jgi:hypothetical protein